MSDTKVTAVTSDMSLLSSIRNTPTNRRGGSDDSERNKIKVLFWEVLDELAGGKTPADREIELTKIVTHFRQMAVNKDGKTVVMIPNGEKKLAKDQRWFFVHDTAFEDRYRKILTYMNSLLKQRKEFVKEEKYSADKGKDLVFIIYKGTAAKVAAPAA